MNNFKLPEFVKLTCWISIVCILWMWVLEIIPSSLLSWFAFGFFFFTLLMVVSYNNKSKP